jgi:hypothetical protein
MYAFIPYRAVLVCGGAFALYRETLARQHNPAFGNTSRTRPIVPTDQVSCVIVRPDPLVAMGPETRTQRRRPSDTRIDAEARRIELDRSNASPDHILTTNVTERVPTGYHETSRRTPGRR